MIKATHTILRRIWLTSLLACIVVLPLSFAGTSSAFAATPSAPPTNFCLREASFIQHDGNNEVLLGGYSTSYCGTNGVVTIVNQQMHITNGCEGTLGTGPSTLPDNFSVPFGSHGFAEYTDQVGCVNCIYVSHNLVGKTYPDFVVFLTVSASGSYKEGGRTFFASDNGVSSGSLLITNTGQYAPYCPPTN